MLIFPGVVGNPSARLRAQIALVAQRVESSLDPAAHGCISRLHPPLDWVCIPGIEGVSCCVFLSFVHCAFLGSHEGDWEHFFFRVVPMVSLLHIDSV
jgi:hypothetical protein